MKEQDRKKNKYIIHMGETKKNYKQKIKKY